MLRNMFFLFSPVGFKEHPSLLEILFPRVQMEEGKPFFVGIHREIILPGFLSWCEMDFVHPQYYLGMFAAIP